MFDDIVALRGGLSSSLPLQRKKNEGLFMEERERGFVFIDFFPAFTCHYDNPLTMWIMYCNRQNIPIIVMSLRATGTSSAIQGPFLDIFVKTPGHRPSMMFRQLAETYGWVSLFPTDRDALDMTHFYPVGHDLYRPYITEEQEQLQQDALVGLQLCEAVAQEYRRLGSDNHDWI